MLINATVKRFPPYFFIISSILYYCIIDHKSSHHFRFVFFCKLYFFHISIGILFFFSSILISSYINKFLRKVSMNMFTLLDFFTASSLDRLNNICITGILLCSAFYLNSALLCLPLSSSLSPVFSRSDYSNDSMLIPMLPLMRISNFISLYFFVLTIFDRVNASDV